MSEDLTNELLRLGDLRERGLINEDEFAMLKRTAITKYTAATQASSNAVGGGGGGSTLGFGGMAEASERKGTFRSAAAAQINSSMFEESHTGAHARAYTHLQTILTNLLRHRDDPKYKVLRLENAKLAAELFSDPGSIPFLTSVGFEAVEGPSVGATGDCLAIRGRTDADIVEAGLAELEHLVARDNAAAEAARHFASLRRGIVLKVRQEDWERARRVGELHAFVIKQFVDEPPRQGDEDYSECLRTLAALRKIVSNVAQNPREPKFRALRVNNAVVATLVLHSPGALEYLCGVCGFVLDEIGLNLPMEFDIAEEHLTFLDEIERSVASHRDEFLKLQREEARRLMLKERRAAAAPAARSDANVQPAAAPSSGKRVKITDALLYLMGKEDEVKVLDE